MKLVSRFQISLRSNIRGGPHSDRDSDRKESDQLQFKRKRTLDSKDEVNEESDEEDERTQFSDDIERIFESTGKPYDPQHEVTPNLPANHPAFH